MPLFKYKAKKGPEEIIEGKIEAESKEAVISHLLEKGCTPLKVGLAEEKSLGAGRPFFFAFSFGKVGYLDVNIFTRQLASLIKSHITLLRALTVITEQTENPSFKKIVLEIEGRVEKGESLSDSLSKYPKIFSALYVNVIRAGETGGALEEAFNRVIEFREKEEELRSMIKSALTYPIFLIIAGILTVFFMLTFFMPRLLDLFNQLGQVLPLPTRMLIAASSFAQANWVWIAMTVSAVILLAKRKNTSKNERIVRDWIKLHLPVVGELIRKSEISKFARALAILIKSGIPLIKAVETAIPLVDTETFKEELKEMNEDIVKGLSVAEGMKSVSQFSPMVLNIVSVGEEGGRLEEALIEVASFYDKEVDRMVKIISSLIEPVIIMIIGLIVGFIVFAMLLPIFNIDMVVK
ncbi:MAG: type II secretion system F family protein [Candidatus Omnitrophota bacterium]